MSDADGPVAVPDLVGLSVRQARDAGHQALVVVVGSDVDGPALGALTWPGVWVVTAQVPVPGSRVRRWDNVRIEYRRAGGEEAGDREPHRPPHSPDGLQAQVASDDA